MGPEETGVAQSVWWPSYGINGWSSIPGRSRDIYLYATASRPALGPTQPPIEGVPGPLSQGIKWPGRESSAEMKNAWNYTSNPPYVVMAWWLVKQRDNFTFPFPLWDPEVHHRVHKSPPLVLNPNQLNPLHTITIYF
jgi:hypothetical protein